MRAFCCGMFDLCLWTGEYRAAIGDLRRGIVGAVRSARGIAMSSLELLALATDALRGQLQSVLPPGAEVIVGVPSREGQAVSGLFVHLLRFGIDPAVRNAPARAGEAGHASPALGLHLDYLIGGLGGEALAELGLLDAALQMVLDAPRHDRGSVTAVLSQPERLAALSPGTLGLRWVLLDLPLDQVSGVWVGCGMRQRAGVFVSGFIAWRSG